MTTPNLQKVMRRVTRLSFTDKLARAAFLLEHLKQDAALSAPDPVPEPAAAALSW